MILAAVMAFTTLPVEVFAEEAEDVPAGESYFDFEASEYVTDETEGVLDENGRMEAFNNDLVIRYLNKVVVKDDSYEVVFKAGVKVEVES